MLDQLDQVIRCLPPLLKDAANWDSLIVNRRKPHTYRVFMSLNGLRVCLHKFNPCDRHEAFSHPHPWPGAFIIMDGAYRMKIGRSIDQQDACPLEVATFVMRKWAAYEIVEPLTWHSVIPLTETYTIMVNGEPFSPDVYHKNVVTTKGKGLDKMPPNDLALHLEKFEAMVADYLQHNLPSPVEPPRYDL